MEAAACEIPPPSDKYDYLWKMVISYKMSELLTIIKSRYPDDLKDSDIKEIVDNIRKRMILDKSPTEKIASNSPLVERKSPKRITVPLEERCLARCWVETDINGKQCSRRKNVDSGLCQQHEDNLPHGLITDPITKRLKVNFEKYGSRSLANQYFSENKK
jgi:hypothetical protein